MSETRKIQNDVQIMFSKKSYEMIFAYTKLGYCDIGILRAGKKRGHTFADNTQKTLLIKQKIK